MTSRRGSTILVLFLVAGTIAWFWYDGQLPLLKGKSFSLNVLPSDLSGFSEKTGKMVKNIQTRGSAALKDVFKTVTEKPKDIAVNVVNDAKQSAAESFKQQVAETLGIATVGSGGAGASVIKGVAIVRLVNQSLSLSIEADENSIKYRVNWGDGVVDSGSLGSKQQNKVDHVWHQAGDYSVNVEIVDEKDDQKKSFAFPIKILK